VTTPAVRWQVNDRLTAVLISDNGSDATAALTDPHSASGCPEDPGYLDLDDRTRRSSTSCTGGWPTARSPQFTRLHLL
jgi:hypothetical protein